MSGEEGSQEWTDRRIEDNFIESYVNRLFDNPLHSLSSHQKMTFGNLMRCHEERDKFSCCVSMKRQLQQVSEETVLSLQQHFALVLFECHQTDDFSTACSLMNMAFTYYFIDHQGRHIYPYMFLKDHQIFHDERFWNAAFFDSLDKLRSSKPLIPIGLSGTSPETLQREQSFLENITFGQLGIFLCYMEAFGLPYKLAQTFLEKQATIADLPAEQRQLLAEYLGRVYQSE